MSKICPVPPKPDMLGNMLVTFGEKDPITEGGGRVFETANGPFFEYTEGTEVDGNVLEVYRTHLGEDLCVQFERLLAGGGLEEMCECRDIKPEIWRKQARGRLSMRAQCIVDLANHFGWEEIDEEPLLLSQVDLQLRWYHQFNLEGPVTTAECLNPVVLAPELLLALRELDQEAHDRLFSRRFPLIPSAPLQDPSSSWWEKHGVEVVMELADLLVTRTPVGYRFSYDSEVRQYGFWPLDGS